MSPIQLSIVIVNWKSAAYVLGCIRSIHDQQSKLSCEIVVVDNASSDDCGKRLAVEFPEVIFVQSLCNVGFARANNLGVRHSRGGVLLFLNPDTEVRGRSVEGLYRRMEELPEPGVVGCRLLNSDGSLQTSCVQAVPTVLNQVLDADLLRNWFPSASLWGMSALFEPKPGPKEVEVVSGACMMIRREVFDRVGGFSEEYFMYAEDLDLCFKARSAGFHNYYLGEFLIVHHGGGSSHQARSDFSNVMVRESVRRFFGKYRGVFYSRCYRLAVGGTAAIRLVLLSVLLPFWLARRRGPAWGVVCRKWVAILRWGLGLTRWTQQYERAEEPRA